MLALVISGNLSSKAAAFQLPSMKGDTSPVRNIDGQDQGMKSIRAIDMMPRFVCEYEKELTTRLVASFSSFATAYAGWLITRKSGASEKWEWRAGGIGFVGGYIGGYYSYQRWGADCSVQSGDPNWRSGGPTQDCLKKGKNYMLLWSVAGAIAGTYAGQRAGGNEGAMILLMGMSGGMLGAGLGSLVGALFVAPCGVDWEKVI